MDPRKDKSADEHGEKKPITSAEKDESAGVIHASPSASPVDTAGTSGSLVTCYQVICQQNADLTRTNKFECAVSRKMNRVKLYYLYLTYVISKTKPH